MAEAFVLVIIVVFLFLGSLRATIIPAIAVPVSLIGAFAVLLVLGYSAYTVSLLAMVLAIGIVVDDAIVVVENVEHIMERHPELSPADAVKRAMAEITAPIHDKPPQERAAMPPGNRGEKPSRWVSPKVPAIVCRRF